MLTFGQENSSQRLKPSSKPDRGLSTLGIYEKINLEENTWRCSKPGEQKCVYGILNKRENTKHIVGPRTQENALKSHSWGARYKNTHWELGTSSDFSMWKDAAFHLLHRSLSLSISIL